MWHVYRNSQCQQHFYLIFQLKLFVNLNCLIRVKPHPNWTSGCRDTFNSVKFINNIRTSVFPKLTQVIRHWKLDCGDCLLPAPNIIIGKGKIRSPQCKYGAECSEYWKNTLQFVTSYKLQFKIYISDTQLTPLYMSQMVFWKFLY